MPDQIKHPAPEHTPDDMLPKGWKKIGTFGYEFRDAIGSEFEPDQIARVLNRNIEKRGINVVVSVPYHEWYKAQQTLKDARLWQEERQSSNLMRPESDAVTPAVERGSVGAILTREQKKSVLKTLVDVYRTKGAEKESKGLDRNGNERMGYAYQPELFEKSDITGAMVRYYVTLPDGRIAHPTELFPEYTQSDIDAEMSRRRYAERNARLDVQRFYAPLNLQFDDKLTTATYWDEKSEASKSTSVNRTATILSSLDRDFLTNGDKFIMVPGYIMKNGDLVEALAAEGWNLCKKPH